MKRGLSIYGIALCVFLWLRVSGAGTMLPDYAPLATGNMWVFSGQFGTKRLRVTGFSGDTVVIAESTFTSGGNGGTVRKYLSREATGMVEARQVSDTYMETRDLWSKHCLTYNDHFIAYNAYKFSGSWLADTSRQAVVFEKPVTTPAGTFQNPVTFIPMPYLVGRPHLVGPKTTVVPGIGPVVLQYSYLMMYEEPPVWTLTKYHIESVPRGTSLSVGILETTPSRDSLFHFSAQGSDSGTLTFRLIASLSAKLVATTSYAQPAKTVRIFVSDSVSRPSAVNSAYDLTAGLRGLAQFSSLRVKIFFRDHRQSNGSISQFYSENRLLYSEAIMPTASLSNTAHREPREARRFALFSGRNGLRIKRTQAAGEFSGGEEVTCYDNAGKRLCSAIFPAGEKECVFPDLYPAATRAVVISICKGDRRWIYKTALYR